MSETLSFYLSRIPNFDSMSFEERREAVKREKLDSKFHTKTTLREIFRVKPIKGVVSDYEFTNSFGKTTSCYTLTQCQVMRAQCKKPLTQRQKINGHQLGAAVKYNSKANKAALTALQLINSGDYVVLDTETTSLNGEVIQIAVVDLTTQELIYESLIHSDLPIDKYAFEKHQISSRELINAPSFQKVFNDLNVILSDKKWLAFNLSFDRRLLTNSFNSVFDKADDLKWIKNSGLCVMYDLAVPALGSSNRHGSISLSDTLHLLDCEFEGDAHQASVDAKATVKAIHKIATSAFEMPTLHF